jgi:hypothetical protein
MRPTNLGYEAGAGYGAGIGIGTGIALSTNLAQSAETKVAQGSGLIYAELDGIRQLLGQEVEGASNLLNRVLFGEAVKIPENVSIETLEQYRRVAERAIAVGRNTEGVQPARLTAINALLASLGFR